MLLYNNFHQLHNLLVGPTTSDTFRRPAALHASGSAFLFSVQYVLHLLSVWPRFEVLGSVVLALSN